MERAWLTHFGNSLGAMHEATGRADEVLFTTTSSGFFSSHNGASKQLSQSFESNPYTASWTPGSASTWFIGNSTVQPTTEFLLPESPYSSGLIIILMTAAVTITVFAIVGNTLIIAAFITTRRLRKLTIYFYFSLAISDLAAGLLVMPFMISFTLNSYWKFGKTICVVWLCIDMFVYSTSVYHMCVICLDRFLAVKYPFRYRVKRTKKLILTFIGVAWGLGLVTEVPITILYEHIVGESVIDYRVECDVEWVGNAIVTICSFLVTVVIPFFFMLILYGQIFYIIRKRGEALKASTLRASSGETNEIKEDAQSKKHFSVAGLFSKRLKAEKDCGDANESKSVGDKKENKSSNKTPIKLRWTFWPGKQKSYDLSDIVADNGDPGTGCVAAAKYNRRSDEVILSSYVNIGFSFDEFSTGSSQGLKDNCSEQTPNDLHQITSDENVSPAFYSNQSLEIESSLNNNTEPSSANTVEENTRNRDRTHPNTIKKKTVNETHHKSSGKSRSSEVRAATTLGILLGVFLITWLPWKITTIVDAFANTYTFPDVWYDIAIWLQYSNSMINPFLYVFREKNFRIAIKRILCRVFCCRKNASSSPVYSTGSRSSVATVSRKTSPHRK
ncbi:muscarinic acetylcholine receptor M2-like [Saccoglossus kowalevskii]|uniref:Histamine H4 receptor-like n=1 Tax=Saccoglossus kowalevskii TaxID=10224 RepID=A0ABM0MWI0_SACKO|nr:PREDICTED: histamine H4 receptor-like [Saccoglossus kowalevskii]